MFGLYLHIPYCRSKCRYCDFYSAACSSGVPDSYIQALCREISRFAENGMFAQPDTLYFGGGTPSLLSPAQAHTLICAAHPAPDAEITLEANPETVTYELLRDFHTAGINRISFGVQTACDESLARLGRRHTAQQSRTALELAAKAGFKNISGDVMLALPDYSEAELDDTLRLLADGGCTHISSYLLKIEPNTVFGRRPPENLPDDDEAADYYLSAVEKLAALGYRQYEISNFSKPGFESHHNLIYWDCGEYLGLGPAAHSCMNGRRFSCAAGTSGFIEHPAVYEEQGVCNAEDYIMLQLRLAHGLSLDALKAQHGISFDAEKMNFIHRLCQNDMAVFENNILRLTPRGMLIQNSILCELL